MNTWIVGKDLIKPHYQIEIYFYSELYLEDITDKDYTNAQKEFKEFGLKNLGDHHDLHVQSHTLLLADVFENFNKKKCIEIYELDPAHFFFCTSISMACLLQKDRTKNRIINRY